MKRTTLLSAALLAVALPLAAQDAASTWTPGESFLTNWDYDGDGQVTLDEVKERRGDLFASFDANEDGKLTPEEFAVHDQMREAMQDGRGMPDGAMGAMPGYGQGTGQGYGQGRGQAQGWGGQQGRGMGRGGGQGWGGQQGQGWGGPQGQTMGHGGWGGQQMGPQGYGYGPQGGRMGMMQPGYGPQGMQAPWMQQGWGNGPRGGQGYGQGFGPQAGQGFGPQGGGQPGFGPQGGQGFGPQFGAQGSAQELAMLDADSDGAVGLDEFVSAADGWFARFDRTGDGVVTAEDFGAMRR